MSKDFRVFKLGEVAKIIAGGDKPKIFSENESVVNNIPVFANGEDNNGLLGYTDIPKINEPAVTISARGSKVGFAVVRKQPFFPIVRLLTLIPHRDRLDVNFLYYNLKQSRQRGTGSGQPQITIPDISNRFISIPPFHEQQKIAAVLSALDDKIALNNRINAELEQMAKTLYDYWFVQFDFSDKNGKPYKSSGGKMVYNEVLKKEIPEGWRNGALEDILALEYGKPLKEKDRSGAGYPVLGSNGIVGYHNRYLVKGPGIVVGRKGSAGEVTWIDQDFYPIDTTYYIRDNLASNSIIYHFFLLQDVKLKQVESSSAVPGLNRNVVHRLSISLPPRELIEKFHQIITPFFEKKSVVKRQNQQLTTLRDWLLPMLMNGQVKVVDNHDITNETLSMAAESQVAYSKKAPLKIPSNKKGFAKQVLAGKIVSKFKDDPNFTDIKFQKIQFLAEHIIEADLNLNYYYQVAGPYDNKFMHTIYDDFRKQKWYDCQDKRFVPLEKQEKIEGYYHGYFASAKEQLNTLFDLLYDSSEAEAEIIATLYAVWNNRLIDGQAVSHQELIGDFYKWGDRKQQYTQEQISAGLQWLRNHQMEPKGFGKLIKKAKGKK
jgi:restriction endonuclease S subunit